MGNMFFIDRSSFNWDYSEEPHKSRRVEILPTKKLVYQTVVGEGKYPEIKRLMKKDGDRSLVFEGILVCLLHVSLGVFQSYFDSRPLKTAYIVFLGPTLATIMTLHLHEAAHGLVFGPNHVWKNRLYGYAINLFMGGAFFAYFKRQHKNHHKYIGDEVLDSEYPSEMEAKIFSSNPVSKFAWFLLNPFIFFIRTPTFILKNSFWEISGEIFLNQILNLSFNIFLLYKGWVDLWLYFIFSALLANESHMFGFWGVSSHVEFLKDKETTSYYGWMNKIFLNFGYHMEHHDFPSIPSKYLPEVTKIAPEFYEDSFTFDSFYSAVVKFLFDPNLGIRSRLKRPAVHQYKYIKNVGENFRKFQ
uniref:Sphingolipid delta4-desaturase N-terminal domain-containing protein n=1 Tax=Romanomermis culicivorax TaxID=13658 RepID=A0A915L518_ROMCU